MNCARLRTVVVLAFLVVFAQLGGTFHGLSHFGDKVGTEHPDKHASIGLACEQCLAFDAVAGGFAPTPTVIPLAENQCRSTPVTFQSAPEHTNAAYRSRGPPILC